ncbi:MAG: hypothetical protein HQK77_03410 [Desulfobacterales bacterium]|nr:hypothetical protein [Desulfobacterales bacterium]
MMKLIIFVGSIISFIIGSIVFLIGIGAIAGCAGGIIAILAGGIISFIGIAAVVSMLLPNSDKLFMNSQHINSVIDLIKQNGQWVSG